MTGVLFPADWYREQVILTKSEIFVVHRRAAATLFVRLMSAFAFILPAGVYGQGAAAIQTVSGRHIVLKSDGGTRQSLQDLVDAFDAAVIQWERFLMMTPGTTADWQIDGFVITDRQLFKDSGEIPRGLNFPFGFATNGNVFVMRQQSDYYTRHLLLHEGVHALFLERFNDVGPSWFAEGVAELLGVHRGTGSDVEVNVVPQSRNDTPFWGRFKLTSQRRIENRIPTINAVLDYPQDLNSDVESYGWCWVAAMLLTEYPEYRAEYMAAIADGSIRHRTFNEALKRRLQSHWPIVEARWRLLTQTIDYGFDWEHERVSLSTDDPIWDGKTIRVPVRADQGWQSTGVRFRPGTRIKISADGRCTINQTTKPWISEPAGVTIQYAQDRPLGQLMLCVLPNRTDELRHLDPLQVTALESDLEFTINTHCWLMLRINDHLDGRGDNRDGYTVTLQK